MEPLSQLVGEMGFPIVAYLLMFRMVTTTMDRNTEAIRAMSDAVRELRDAVTRLARECDRPASPDRKRDQSASPERIAAP